MIQTPELELVQKLMQPGVISKDGFLGNDTRNLAHILSDDQRIVSNLGFTHKELADAMEELKEAGKQGFGNPVLVKGFLEVTVDSSKGKIASPFGGLFNKENIVVLNKKTGETIRWTTLNIHMIRDHGFYEGKGSYFRVEPEELVRVLEL